MHRWLLFCLILLVFCVKANAVDVLQTQLDMFGTENLEDHLPQEAQEILEGFDPGEETDLIQGVETVFRKSASKSAGAVKRALQVMLRILAVIMLGQLVAFSDHEQVKTTVSAAVALAITICCSGDLKSMIGLGRETMHEITAFSAMLMPVMAAAAAASGGTNGAGMTYSLMTMFSGFLMKASDSLIIPAVYAYLALGMADCVLQQDRLKRLRELLGRLIEWTLKGIVYGFTAFLGACGIFAGNVDAAALKAVKFTISGVVPVVGGMISNAAETVLSGASVLKGLIGTYGMLAVLALFLTPFLKMSISYFSLRLTAGLSGILDCRQSGYLETVSGAMGYLVAMIASCTWITLLACISCMKVVHG